MWKRQFIFSDPNNLTADWVGPGVYNCMASTAHRSPPSLTAAHSPSPGSTSTTATSRGFSPKEADDGGEDPRRRRWRSSSPLIGLFPKSSTWPGGAVHLTLARPDARASPHSSAAGDDPLPTFSGHQG